MNNPTPTDKPKQCHELTKKGPYPWVCNECGFTTSDDDIATKHSMIPVEAQPTPKPAEGELEQILKGIDREDALDPDGWWETSTGAEFGARKLAELKAYIGRWYGSKHE